MTQRSSAPLVVLVLSVLAFSSANAQRWSPRTCVTDTTAIVPDTSRTTTVDTVALGIQYRCILDRRGPWAIHVVAVDLRRGTHSLEGIRALNSFHGRERVSDMALRLDSAGRGALVGINADFFDLRTGEVENNHVVRGEWVKGALVTDSPHDEFDNAHTQFALDVRGRPVIGRFGLRGSVFHGRRVEPLVGINYRPPRREGLVLFTPWYGKRTPTDTSARIDAEIVARPDSVRPSAPVLRADSARRLSSQAARHAAEVVLTRIGRRGDSVLYRAKMGAPVTTGGGTAIPAMGAVLSSTGSEAHELIAALASTGGLVKVLSRLDSWSSAPQTVVGGWPRVVAGGRNVGALSDSLEGTFPRFSSSRHPRSALGITRDSSTLLMVVVDGRRRWTVGMSLVELGEVLLSLGAWDGMNLDGGGSSALWIRGRIVNAPSDANGERSVGNALFVVKR